MADKKEKPKIELTENGPLIVKNLDNLTTAKGDQFESKPVMALCRCGASENKPFCDGTHAKFGFFSQNLGDGKWNFRENYTGKEVVVHDNRGICSHAGYCTSRLPSVWKMGVEPWIEPDGDTAEKIVNQVRMCPSGALSYSIDGVEHRNQDRDPEIHVTKDGPLYVRGGIELVDVEKGEEASDEHYTLCRCGWSKNKPFCDGSHWYVKFRDAGQPIVDESALEGERETSWYKVAELDELSEGSVKVATAGSKRVALSYVNGAYGALDNHCAHQGGPLGEGTIEAGCLRCPWHGWDFDPKTGQGITEPESSVATYPLEVRDDGIYVAVEEVKTHTPTVTDLMAETMVNWGITHVFGMVGHSNLGLADALRIQEEAENITYIGIRHEGAAAFAASGYAKVSGKPCACIAIAGPGATNLLTGLWDAKMDRAPVLALTGQVNTQVLGPGAFQEIDQASAFSAVARWSQTVLHDSNHAELMSLALKHAIVERDVAHLIFPDEVQVLAAPESSEAGSPAGRIGPVDITPPSSSVKEAVELIGQSKRPAIIVGYGAREGMAGVIELAEKLNCPVLTTFKGKGQISDSHPLAAGVLGRSGTPIASSLMNESDLLIVFGASFSNHTGIEERKPTIQVDFDRMALGKFHGVDVPIWGEISVTAQLLLKQLPKSLDCENQRDEIASSWASWREEKSKRASKESERGLNSAVIFDVLSKIAPENAVIAVDVGNNTYSFGRYFECQNQSVIMSGYLGSIGFGFPAAMGAWAAAPDRPILSVSGDGGFGQYVGEFTTAVKYNMNITHFLLNNHEIGKISKEQRDGQWAVWQTSLHNPNFAEYAENCGGLGIRVESAEELEAAFKKGLEYDGPALIEIMTDSELI